jgi:hypothetical protein
VMRMESPTKISSVVLQENYAPIWNVLFLQRIASIKLANLVSLDGRVVLVVPSYVSSGQKYDSMLFLIEVRTMKSTRRCLCSFNPHILGSVFDMSTKPRRSFYYRFTT